MLLCHQNRVTVQMNPQIRGRRRRWTMHRKKIAIAKNLKEMGREGVMYQMFRTYLPSQLDWRMALFDAIFACRCFILLWTKFLSKKLFSKLKKEKKGVIKKTVFSNSTTSMRRHALQMGGLHLEVYENGCKERGIPMHASIMAELGQLTERER